MKEKINKILKLANLSPVIALNENSESFNNAIILPANIKSKDLGVVALKQGLKVPTWFTKLFDENKKIIVIDKLDTIDLYNQEKFYELLKYKTISSVNLPDDCSIIITALDINKISPNILSLCLIYKE